VSIDFTGAGQLAARPVFRQKALKA